MLEVLRNIVLEVNAAASLDEALAIIVSRVRGAMGTEVCSVYIRDRVQGRFVFRATEGLNGALIGHASLAPGEGLVGLVAQREEPVNLEDAELHPNFHLLPDLGEEAYHAFLGVPIIHQREVLGVLVVQQARRRRFDDGEEAFLVTMSAQLAGVIAHALVTGEVPDEGSPGRSSVSARISGVPGAPGIGIGRAVVVTPVADLFAVPRRCSDDRRGELRAFRQALASVRSDVASVAENLGDRLNPEELALFDVYLAILNDSAIGAEVASLIRNGQWAQGALAEVMIRHIRHFEGMEHSYLRERAVDVRDLGERVLAYLQAAQRDEQSYPERTVLISEDLTASMLGEVPRERLAGLVSVRGSGNSHVAILARAMGIPTVMGAQGLPYQRLGDMSVVVDGYNGNVHLNPRPEILHRFRDIVEQDQAFNQELEALRELPCVTRDEQRLTLWVNTGLAADVARSLERGAEGVGLYRTEVPFLMREGFPTEEEQRQIYREHLEAFAPRPVTMRTLDVGGDKALPYFPIEEANPFLGWRGIRVTLDHPEILLAQVRAMLKANAGLGNLRIMLPMVSNIPELDEALELVYRSHRELEQEGIEAPLPPIGVMVEVPAAVYQAQAMARRVDFLSVGSNDLTQYLLAVDRNNPRVSDLYHALHPAVLEALQQVAAGAHAEGKQVSICGELAGDPLSAVLLLAMGYDVLSMNATSLPRVKRALRAVSAADAATLLESVRRLESADAVQRRVADFLGARGLQQFAPAPVEDR